MFWASDLAVLVGCGIMWAGMRFFVYVCVLAVAKPSPVITVVRRNLALLVVNKIGVFVGCRSGSFLGSLLCARPELL